MCAKIYIQFYLLHARFCTGGYKAESTPIHFQYTTYLIRLLLYAPHFSLFQTTSSISVY